MYERHEAQWMLFIKTVVVTQTMGDGCGWGVII